MAADLHWCRVCGTWMKTINNLEWICQRCRATQGALYNYWRRPYTRRRLALERKQQRRLLAA